MRSARKLRTTSTLWRCISSITIFVRIHQTLKVTPAMAAGVTDRLWEMKDVVAMLEAWEAAN
jgi:hypothetical protein